MYSDVDSQASSRKSREKLLVVAAGAGAGGQDWERGVKISLL